MDTEIDVRDVVLQTPRLLLRPWRESDLEDFYEYARVDGVGEMAGWKHHESIDKSKEILKNFLASKSEFAIELKSNKKVIGSFGFHKSWANDREEYSALNIMEIGYVLSKDYWGQRLMPEAVKAVIDYCFGTLMFDALTVGHFEDNFRSRRVIEKNGFNYVSTGDYFSAGLNKNIKTKQYILFRESWLRGDRQ